MKTQFVLGSSHRLYIKNICMHCVQNNEKHILSYNRRQKLVSNNHLSLSHFIFLSSLSPTLFNISTIYFFQNRLTSLIKYNKCLLTGETEQINYWHFQLINFVCIDNAISFNFKCKSQALYLALVTLISYLGRILYGTWCTTNQLQDEVRKSVKNHEGNQLA